MSANLPAIPPPPPPPDPGQEIAWIAENRLSGMKGNAWLWWIFLGGVGAHLAYLFPKARAWIVVGMILLNVVTLGVAGILLWCFGWIPLLVNSTYDTYRRVAWTEAEREVLTRRSVYGLM